MSVNYIGLRDKLVDILNVANTTTASFDLSEGLGSRVKSVQGYDLSIKPIWKPQYPIVSVRLVSKDEEPETIGNSNNFDRLNSVTAEIYGVYDDMLNADTNLWDLLSNIETVMRDNISLDNYSDGAYEVTQVKISDVSPDYSFSDSITYNKAGMVGIDILGLTQSTEMEPVIIYPIITDFVAYVPTATSAFYNIVDDTVYGTGYVSASSELDLTHSAYNIIDRNENTYWESHTSLSAADSYIYISTHKPTAIKYYKVTSINEVETKAPVSWIFQGSKNGQDWDDLEIITNNTSLQTQNTEMIRIIDTVELYSFYRIYVTEKNGDTVALNEFNIDASYTVNEYTILTLADFTPTASSESASGPLARAFDSTIYTSYYSNYAGTNWVQLDFGVEGLVMQKFEMNITYATTVSPDNIIIVGSNDGTNWVELYTMNYSTLKTFSHKWMYLTFENDTKYRYYRLNQRRRNGSSNQARIDTLWPFKVGT